MDEISSVFISGRSRVKLTVELLSNRCMTDNESEIEDVHVLKSHTAELVDIYLYCTE